MSEYNRVKETIETYIMGSRQLDYEKTISVVHPDGRMFIGQENISKNLYEHWKKGFPKQIERYGHERFYDMYKVDIVSIEVNGTIAYAKISSGNWVDYHGLVLVNNEWKIVSKLSHYVQDGSD
jgi:hypothetical protein